MSEQITTLETHPTTSNVRRWIVGAVVLAVVLIAAVAWAKRGTAVAASPEPALRAVRTSTPRRAEARAAIALPGTARPSAVTTLVAKATGYVRELRVDLGDHVAAGQQLMTIEAEEVVQELALARARLQEATENVALAETTATRARRLSDSGAVSQQEREDTQAHLNTARAAVATARAEVDRLRVLVGYQRITAPFAGIVVRRMVDPGALAQSGQTALLELAATDYLRIEVDVPQTLAASITPGLEVDVSGKDVAGPPLRATVWRTAGALSSTTRTMRIEVRIPGNANVLPNSYVTVAIQSMRAKPPLIVPSHAVSTTGAGTMVGVLRNGVVELRPVGVVRDLGKELEIEGELDERTEIILNLPADLRTGERVDVATRTEASAS
jgi:RND family efflux transporter MFP subunit